MTTHRTTYRTTHPTTHHPPAAKVMFRQLVSGAKKLATGGGHAGDGSTPAADQLFPKVQPEVDGDDCLRDCDSCSVQYPRGFKIEEHDELYGHVKGWATHVLVATGKTDWVRDVADEKGSVMEALDRAEKPSNGVRLDLPFSLSLCVYIQVCCRKGHLR